ncbi:MAG: FAD:protein FMN transferase [Gammaproteobacteria bacterium]|nr:FAD:protein FMN transferase [Gammaproteobacteria bacterium]
MRLLARPRLRGVILVILTLAVAIGCGGSDPVSRGKVRAFDTTIDITLIGVDRQRAAELTEILKNDFETMEQAWHAWGTGPVTYMNELFNAGTDSFVAPPSVLPILRLSQQLALQSEGMFNPAIGHLVRAWGFQGRPGDCLRPPAQDVIDAAVDGHPSMQDITIDGIRVSSRNQTVKLDFRHIQHGFAIDQAIARLQELGVHNASISGAGGLRAIGSRGGNAWSVPVRGPDGGALLATVQIKGNEAAFTLAPFHDGFTWEGKRYHDVINPRTGYPATGFTSVTVLHPNASTAEAAANALFVAGPEDWFRIAKTMGLRYVMLTDDEGRLHMNPAMKDRIKLHARNREVIISEPLT